MAVKENSEPDDLEWSTEEEVQLLYALDGLRPVGINKHFYMARICERMSNALKRDIAPETIWSHLRTWYNLDALDQMERVPFAEEEVEFELPDSEFSALMTKKLAEVEEKKPVETKTEPNTKGKYLFCSILQQSLRFILFVSCCYQFVSCRYHHFLLFNALLLFSVT